MAWQARLAAGRGRSLCARVRADSVLIANTKGGGHAFIGLHLAKQLLDSGHSVTILNDGDEVHNAPHLTDSKITRHKFQMIQDMPAG